MTTPATGHVCSSCGIVGGGHMHGCPATAPSPSDPRDDDLVREARRAIIDLGVKTADQIDWEASTELFSALLVRLVDRIVEQDKAIAEYYAHHTDWLDERTSLRAQVETALNDRDAWIKHSAEVHAQLAERQHTGPAHPPNAEGTSEGEVQNMTGRLRESAEDHRILEKWAKHEMLEAASMIERLAARLAEAQKDAERYRWLRDIGSETWVPFKQQWCMSATSCDNAVDRELRNALPQRSAIDAAMREGNG